jgi:hypothetical protein
LSSIPALTVGHVGDSGCLDLRSLWTANQIQMGRSDA